MVWKALMLIVLCLCCSLLMNRLMIKHLSDRGIQVSFQTRVLTVKTGAWNSLKWQWSSGRVDLCRKWKEEKCTAKGTVWVGNRLVIYCNNLHKWNQWWWWWLELSMAFLDDAENDIKNIYFLKVDVVVKMNEWMNEEKIVRYPANPICYIKWLFILCKFLW